MGDDGESLMQQSFIGICASSFGSYVGGLGDDHINSPSIISSGESKESATLCHVAVEEDSILLGGTRHAKSYYVISTSWIVIPHQEIIEYVDYDAEEDDDTPLPIVVHDKAPIIDNDNNVFTSYGVFISDNATARHTNNDNKCGISYYGYQGYNYNVTSINDDGRTQNRREINYGEKDVAAL